MPGSVVLKYPPMRYGTGDAVKMKVCLTTDLRPGQMINVDVLGRTVLVVNVEGTFHAMDGICSHGLADLSRGHLDGFIVECPRHAARYDVRDGKVVSGPVGVEGRALDLRSYPVTVDRDCVTVDL
ncbi:MAG: Rieske 2Fe-2S domain-containing protein [Methanomassiliicoccus sp.]|nr:Rieske 2Fe-2S domain-containing protein [Methanomassiliicoccus sp.]